MTLFYLRRVLWMMAGSIAFGVVVLISGFTAPPQPITSGVASIGGPFRLTTHQGKTLSDNDLKGKPFLVFFGFTHCPDICPTTLMTLTDRFRALGADADKLTTLFITVDPERDTEKFLSLYMEAFDPRFIALTGEPSAIEAVAKNYKAFVRKVPVEGGYTVDHNAIVYMMDRKGRFAQSLDPHESEDVQLAKLRRLIAD